MDSPSLSWREKLGYAVLLLALIVGSVLSPWLLRPLSAGTQLFVMGMLLVYSGVFLALVLHPYTSFLGPNVRPVEEQTDDTLTELCDRLDTPVRGVWATDDLRRSYDFAEIFGVFPWNRHLVVETTFFDTYTPEERAAVVAREASLAESYYRFVGSSLGYLSVVAYFLVVATVERAVGWDETLPNWPFVPEVLLVILIGLGAWYARREVYRADKFAAEQTSAEMVVSALEKFADEKGKSDSESAKIRLLSLFWTRPSPQKRIERLRNHFDVEKSATEE